MRLGSLKTAATIAQEHGVGVILHVGAQQFGLRDLTVVDHPKDLAFCHGYTQEGDLLIFDAEDVDAARIPPDDSGRQARLRIPS